MERIIFHIDVNNAFLSWTAIYLLEHGYKVDIRKIPSIIGGDEKERRGIVLAKSPVAKKMGIVTGEPIFQARKKCPNLQVFPANREWYQIESRKFKDYLKQYSPNIEEFSIDECFVDMTGTNYLYKDYVALAHKIKDEIKNMYGFTVNVGIGNNKLCAKMASDFEKPDKVHTLLKDEIASKLWPLDVKKLFMVGKKTSEELHRMNINTIEQLAHTDYKKLEKIFKKQAEYLKNASWGIDNSEVNEENYHKDNSISTTRTLKYDTDNTDKLKECLLEQTERVSRELREKKKYASTVAVIFKDKNFNSYSAQEKLDNPTDNTKEIYKKVINIFDKNFKKEALRLIGVRLSDLNEIKNEQISIFDADIEEKKDIEIEHTIDSINKKFGSEVIISASLKQIAKDKKKKQ